MIRIHMEQARIHITICIRIQIRKIGFLILNPVNVNLKEVGTKCPKFWIRIQI